MPPDTGWLLAIDAGNTRIKWGVHDGSRWHTLGAVRTGEAHRLVDQWREGPTAQHAIASNVAGDETRMAIENACARTGIPLQLVRSQKEQLGVTSAYEDPAQLGADRWAALVAAHAALAGHKLVVVVGTALTIDALTADGQFLGGLIVPGPALMRRSLDRGTAALRLTEGEVRDFPRRTPDAITTGALQASAGAVERLARGMAAHGTPPAAIVLSGGAARELAPHLHIPPAIHENLVLDGLALIARAR